MINEIVTKEVSKIIQTEEKFMQSHLYDWVIINGATYRSNFINIDYLYDQ